jgi:hypothetical protein
MCRATCFRDELWPVITAQGSRGAAIAHEARQHFDHQSERPRAPPSSPCGGDTSTLIALPRTACRPTAPRDQAPTIRHDDQREPLGQIICPATLELHPSAVLAGDDPKAVVLNFMQPQRARRKLVIGKQHVCI